MNPAFLREAIRLSVEKMEAGAGGPFGAVVVRDGVIVGSVTSGAWGHRVGASLGLGYVSHPEGVTDAWLGSGTWEVEIAWQRHPVTAQLRPWYDPKGERLKG